MNVSGVTCMQTVQNSVQIHQLFFRFVLKTDGGIKQNHVKKLLPTEK